MHRTTLSLSYCLVRAYSTCPSVKKTVLHDFHVANGGKMVTYAGFSLPVQYSDTSVASSHLHTRQHASLFDVSHMLQTEIIGDGSIPLIESLTTADVINLPVNASTLTVYTRPQDGGILDDLIVTKLSDRHLFVVSNAATAHQDQQLLLGNAKHVKIKFFAPEERSLLALQGPEAAAILQPLTDIDLSKLYFMTSSVATVAGCGACRITRCGYTGEDGFEISIPSILTEVTAREILKVSPNVKLAGLAARDSLRLEAGLCLYGNDINTTTTPIEAGLAWLVAKRRRQQADFPGADVILRQLKEGVARRRVGLVSEAGPPARANCHIFDRNDRQIGQVTSGCPSPSLGKNVAMGYVETNADVDGGVRIQIRDRLYDSSIVKMPFVRTNYYTKPKNK